MRFRIADFGFRNGSPGCGMHLRQSKTMAIDRNMGSCSIPQSAFRTPKSHGFTLIEIVVTIVIVGIIATLAAAIILQGVRAYTAQEDRGEVHYQTRLALERMAREIRTVRSPGEIGTAAFGAIVSNPTSSLVFTDVTGTTISYRLSGTNLNRIAGGSTAVLAQGINLLEFRHYDSTDALITGPTASLWFIEIGLRSQQGSQTLQMRTRVHPRNF